MKNLKDKELLSALADKAHFENLPTEQARDLVNVVFDALNSTVGGIIITDMNSVIKFVNPSFCRLFEYQPNQIINQNAAVLFATREVKNISNVISIIDISKNDTEEFSVERSDGQRLIVEVSASHVFDSSGQIVGRMASFVDISKRKKIEMDRDKLIQKLKDALERVKTLRGLIPICAACKKIRDDKGFWHEVEKYIKEHSGAEFSHGLCPKCLIELYPNLE